MAIFVRNTPQSELYIKSPRQRELARQLTRNRPKVSSDIDYVDTEGHSPLHQHSQSSPIDYTPEPVYEDSSFHQDYEGLDVDYNALQQESVEPANTTPDSFLHFIREDHSQNLAWEEGHDQKEIRDAVWETKFENQHDPNQSSGKQEIDLHIHMAQSGYFDPPPEPEYLDQGLCNDLQPQPDLGPNLEQRVNDPYAGPFHLGQPQDPFSNPLMPGGW